MIRSYLSSLWLAVWLALPGVASAQAVDGLVTVDEFEFTTFRLAGADGEWMRVAIELRAGANPLPEARNPRFVDDVSVRVFLGFQGPDGALLFYRSAADLVSLEQGEERVVEFFLPPEVVGRERLNREPFAGLVEIAVGGRTLPLAREHIVGSALSDAARIDGFKGRIEEAAEATDGILLPVYETPFYRATDRERMRTMPAYRIRRGVPPGGMP